MGKNRRKRYYVGEGGQKGLLVGALFLIVVLVVIASGLFYILANRSLESAAYRAHFETLRHTMDMLLPWLIFVNITALIVVIVLAVFLTHKISGPAFHLIRDLDRLKEGDLTVRTTLRKRDRLREISDAFNEAVAKLDEKMADIKSSADEMQAAGGETELPKDKLEKLKRAIGKFKTQ